MKQRASPLALRTVFFSIFSLRNALGWRGLGRGGVGWWGVEQRGVVRCAFSLPQSAALHAHEGPVLFQVNGRDVDYLKSGADIIRVGGFSLHGTVSALAWGWIHGGHGVLLHKTAPPPLYTRQPPTPNPPRTHFLNTIRSRLGLLSDGMLLEGSSRNRSGLCLVGER